jgi:hypothetical protein
MPGVSPTRASASQRRAAALNAHKRTQHIMSLLMQAEIYAVTGLGKLRVTDGWFDSALYCNPEDDSPFVWNLFGEPSRAQLSPIFDYTPIITYASVRTENEWYVQTCRSPYNPEYPVVSFITEAGDSEQFTLHIRDFFVVQIVGFYGGFLRVNNQMDSGYYAGMGGTGDKAGYRVRDMGMASDIPDKWCFWFLKPVKPSIQAMGMADAHPTAANIQSVLQSQNVNISLDELAPLMRQIS